MFLPLKYKENEKVIINYNSNSIFLLSLVEK
ncbi:hypothetical protein O185_02605 [Photorhabdus temperata J3]|uniref:Uncharacterized protein n=1 Tax=Photorhabdus temperata J3 TaxID=1389415 RepID=U7R4D9_PHOTE|nr:hypothetical protein O185_02605 [Photorhabdus temperata J3]